MLVLRQDRVDGDVHHERRTGHQPLDPDGDLNEDGEEQQQSLVRGRQIHAAVQADQEHALNQQRCENDSVSHPGAETHDGTGELGRGGGEHRSQAGATEQPQQQHLTEEQVSAARGRSPRLAQYENFEPRDHDHGDRRKRQDRYDPHLVPEQAPEFVGVDGTAGAHGLGDVAAGGGGRRRAGRHQEELGAHLQSAFQCHGRLVGGPDREG